MADKEREKVIEREKQVQEIIDNMEPDEINGAIHELFGIYDRLESGEFETVEYVKAYVERIIEMYA